MGAHAHTHTNHSKIPGLILGFTSQEAIWLAIITNSCEGPSHSPKRPEIHRIPLAQGETELPRVPSL